jgi:hypothetical protein
MKMRDKQGLLGVCKAPMNALSVNQLLLLECPVGSFVEKARSLCETRGMRSADKADSSEALTPSS